jgi:branched-chain amino acid transport system permease protein
LSALAARIPSREQVGSLLTLRKLPMLLVGALVLFAVLYVVVITKPIGASTGNWRTTSSGSAIDNPASFLATLFDSITFAGWLFIVASGFSLIFGLMRVVNMAHGTFYLLGGFIAYEIQQSMTGNGYTVASAEVNTWEWVLPLLVAVGCVAVVGLVTQQTLLRWNQGQDLRQALITIAVSVIVADQIIAHFPRSVPPGAAKFGGIAVSLTWPGWSNRLVDLHVAGVHYSIARMFILALAIGVGVALWLWLYRTKIGMVIRAGVDDRQMTSALGINIQVIFAIAFLAGSALAGFGSAVGAAQSGVGPGGDAQWLLNSLVVVIVGGMGSLVGAAVGAVLYAVVLTFSSAYLPVAGGDCCSQYSITLTFALIALVLAFRPQGLFGRVE